MRALRVPASFQVVVVLLPVLVGCGPDASTVDAGRPDAGGMDAGRPDAGSPDAGGEDVAGALNGLRWEIPCLTTTTPQLCTTRSTNVSVMAALTGAADAGYDVTVRFRGVVEPKTYTGGTRDGWFQTGGTPSSDTANIYRLFVSSPPQTFFVNAGTTRLSTMLFCEGIDYQRTIRARSGATFTLTAEPRDALQIRNVDDAGVAIVVPGVPPAPATFDGQFVQMDVVSVSRQP